MADTPEKKKHPVNDSDSSEEHELSDGEIEEGLGKALSTLKETTQNAKSESTANLTSNVMGKLAASVIEEDMKAHRRALIQGLMKTVTRVTGAKRCKFIPSRGPSITIGVRCGNSVVPGSDFCKIPTHRQQGKEKQIEQQRRYIAELESEKQGKRRREERQTEEQDDSAEERREKKKHRGEKEKRTKGLKPSSASRTQDVVTERIKKNIDKIVDELSDVDDTEDRMQVDSTNEKRKKKSSEDELAIAVTKMNELISKGEAMLSTFNNVAALSSTSTTTANAPVAIVSSNQPSPNTTTTTGPTVPFGERAKALPEPHVIIPMPSETTKSKQERQKTISEARNYNDVMEGIGDINLREKADERIDMDAEMAKVSNTASGDPVAQFLSGLDHFEAMSQFVASSPNKPAKAKDVD